MVSKDGMSMDESKVAAVKEWALPTTLHGVQSFHGLVLFYQRFSFMILALSWHQSQIALELENSLGVMR